MATRRPFQYLLQTAWQQTINSHYDTRQINSERSLQALFWRQLNEVLPENRRTFIEPRILTDDTVDLRRRYPDLVICNSSSVIAVIELKYNPKVGPRYKKDVKTLQWIAENTSSLHVENSRYLGENGSTKKFTFARRVLYCWASVHKAVRCCKAKTIVGEIDSLRNAFLELHAETLSDGSPNTGWSSN